MQLQQISDKTAIGLSFLCVLHCLFLPLLLLLLPPIAGLLALNDEVFHLALLYVIVPLSAVTLIVGYRRHKQSSVLTTGMTGLTLLLAAVLFGHDYLGETGEVLLTVIGSVAVAWGHLRNYRLRQCQQEQGQSEGVIEHE